MGIQSSDDFVGNPKMNTLRGALLLLAVASAGSALVIKSPEGDKSIRLGSVKQCPGGPYDMTLTSGNLPDKINIPSEVELNVVTDVAKELPMDLMVSLRLQKYQPFPLNVPCMNGIGSCDYDGCKVLDKLCNTLPPNIPCKCPMPAGHFVFDGVKFKIPDMGKIMDKLMAGKYKGEIKFYGKSVGSDKPVGCFDMDFEFTAN